MQNSSSGLIATNTLTMNLSLQHQREIRELLATGQRDQVVKRYREITGCGQAIAEADIRAFPWLVWRELGWYGSLGLS
jgi:hypothetical protein